MRLETDCGVENSRVTGMFCHVYRSVDGHERFVVSVFRVVQDEGDLIKYEVAQILYCPFGNQSCIVLTGSLTLKNKAYELKLLTFFCAKRKICYLNCKVVGSSREN
jgi:hypothetical protein